MMKKPRSWRRQRMVDKQVQGHLIWKLFSYFMGYNMALVTVMVICFFFQHAQTILEGTGGNFWSNFQAFLYTRQPLLISMVALMPVMLWDMLNTSHRFAGPIYRFRRTIEEFSAGGPLRSVKLRDGDFLTDFEQSFNEFVMELHKRGIEAPTAESPANEGDDSEPSDPVEVEAEEVVASF